MRLELRIEHSHDPQAVERRLLEVARARGVSVRSGGDGRGELEKKVGFLGRVLAEYAVATTHVEFVVLEAPPLVGESALRGLLEDEIGRELSALGDDDGR